MKKKIYIIQPTYRLMDGTLLKEFPIFNYSYNLPLLSATIPTDWEKQFGLEYCDDVDFNSDASVILITSTGYDIAHAVDIALKFKRKGKISIFGAHMDDLSDQLMRQVCNSVFYGYPNPLKMAEILKDIESGNLQAEYHCGMNIDFPFDYSVFRNKKMWFIPALASLGCRYSCSYCCYTPIFSGHYRVRHVDNVITDLRSAHTFHRPIVFLDANLYNNRTYLKRLCERILSEEIHMRWGGQCTIDIGDDREVLRLMRKAGCHMLFFGLETLDQNNMIQLNKSFDTYRYADQLRQVRNAGIHIGAFFMLGLDEDNIDTFEMVYKFCRDTKIAVPYVHIFFPVPGTPLENTLAYQNRLPTTMFDQYLEKMPQFSVPCSFAYFTPKKLTVNELENRYLQLFGKLTRFSNIIRRTMVINLFDAGIIFKLNLEARRKYRSMIKAQKIFSPDAS
ncbi:MAG: radical SAM protein [Ignavibacteriales bacterium]|nr:radical SAM protein [Ignavibacteriales bacterium]